MTDIPTLLANILTVEGTVNLILLPLAVAVQISVLTTEPAGPIDIRSPSWLVHTSIGADGISSPLLGLCIFREEQELQDCEQAYH